MNCIKTKFLFVFLALIVLVSGCMQQPPATGDGTTPPIGGNDDTVVPPTDGGGGTVDEAPPQIEPEGEEIDEVAPAVEPETVISETNRIARFVASITDNPLPASTDRTVSVFKGNGNDENFVPPGQQEEDQNDLDDDDENETDGSRGNGSKKPERVDLNKMTALNITIGEISIHLSRSFESVPDVNETEDENEAEVPDLNEMEEDENEFEEPDLNETEDENGEVPDVNTTEDENNGIDDLNESEENDENQNEDVNLGLQEDENAVGEQDSNASTKKKNKWILLSEEEQTFDLLQLIDTEALLADKEIPAGKYTQIRLQILSATAVIDGNEFDVRVPPNKLMLHGVFNADANSIVFMSLDFDVGKSVHVTGNNQIILRPTIRLKVIEDTEVSVEDGEVEAESGETVEESEQEFDEEGEEAS